MGQAVLASSAVSALVLPRQVGDRIATDGAWVRNFPLGHAYRQPGVELIISFRYMPRYARLIYNGYWFSPERRLLQMLIDTSQQPVNGTVRLKLYKGTVQVTGRASKTDSLFDPEIATFEEDQGAYNQADAEGFIRLNALRLRIAAKLKSRKK